ncbi:electron transport complex subunit RsxC [Photobacterium sp. OFAV2-7]|uniref:electron transport complex subunit RsxC n=1 Tax=Photobacterium sp. OFAV2-7 TaxID=2917748 RepID=UPI001EF3D731|nr:electron transport complex subunit RsxC [Photobacterium sp. OFAV2-7]MCG7586198.1 electron transport complex subunit RsxC [Photobacterium sp. OFAV2-7]
MLSIIEQIKQGQLWDFPGGIHPPEQKALSSHSEIAEAKIPNELVLPLKQHIGAVGDVLVTAGDKVLKGQALTHADVALSVPVHAPTSGTIKAIKPHTIAHPSGLSDLCIIIEPDGKDTWGEKTTIADYRQAEAADLIDHIRLQGISGMGGAGFPAGRKLQSGLGKTDILIINAAECEPYITADDRLMQDNARDVVEGIRILNHILAPKLTIIGIEDNKPEAIEALQRCISEEDGIVIRAIPTKYPSGGEKQLIKVLTGKEVPTKGIPADIGIMMHNVGTTYAIKRAVVDGEPLIQRVVTVTGKTFKQPGNTWALLGTPVNFLLERFGYKADKKLPRVIMGGPMMGFTLPHCNVPITKIANCILAPTRKEISPTNHEMSCIRCTACAEACPVSLLPQQLQWYAKDQDYAKCEEYNLFDCIECGACAYVCPSEIPLVQYYRQAKAEIRQRKQDEVNAERAKQRFEAKKARLERDKAERENRFKKAADERRKEMAASGGDDAVAAAIARVKAKQAAASSGADTDKKPAVAAAIARAKAKQAAAQSGDSQVSQEALPDNTEMAKLREERKRLARERKAAKQAESTAEASAPSSTGDTKKDAVTAAIARAKARKAAQASEQAPEAPEPAATEAEADPKKAAVAAAIARAKARKAAQASEQAQETPEPAAIDAEADPKKAAVAAAIARAKARKAAQASEQAQETPEPAATEAEAEAEADPKKAAVAAAIARAKARKAAKEAEAQAEQTQDEPVSTVTEEDVDPKKAAVAAAVARAKARKAAKEAEAQAEQTQDEPVSTVTEEGVDPKKAAVAAAIARAKARKAAKEAEAQAEQTQDEPVSTVTEEDVDPKKAAVAAAIARAKARKAAQQAAKDTQQNNEDN